MSAKAQRQCINVCLSATGLPRCARNDIFVSFPLIPKKYRTLTHAFSPAIY